MAFCHVLCNPHTPPRPPTRAELLQSLACSVCDRYLRQRRGWGRREGKKKRRHLCLRRSGRLQNTIETPRGFLCLYSSWRYLISIPGRLHGLIDLCPYRVVYALNFFDCSAVGNGGFGYDPACREWGGGGAASLVSMVTVFRGLGAGGGGGRGQGWRGEEQLAVSTGRPREDDDVVQEARGQLSTMSGLASKNQQEQHRCSKIYNYVQRTWLVNSRVIAKKVKNATIFSSCPVKDWVTEAMRQCPNCKHRIDNSDVSLEWPGLPAGVKFDPSDVELVEHLAGKVGHGNSKPHVFIDEFIPTLEGDEGICYTHPENLPGVKKDGSSAHFFHRTFNAYATGHRKRRKILSGHNLSREDVRWHKTGKTRPVVENGIQKGFKKIMVLYKSSKKGLKPVKTNWVMHQYHLGTEEDEQEREFVVSKVFLQSQAKGEKIDVDPADVDAGTLAAGVSPITPKTHTPYPPRVGKNCRYDEGDDDNLELLFKQGKNIESQFRSSHTNVRNSSEVWAGESQAVEDPDPNNLVVSLMCDEVLDPLFPVEGSKPKHPQCSWKDFGRNEALGKDNMLCGFPDLDSIDTDTPPDFNLADLQFGSQDSLISWLDWL